jgi:hypothetical protein
MQERTEEKESSPPIGKMTNEKYKTILQFFEKKPRRVPTAVIHEKNQYV